MMGKMLKYSGPMRRSKKAAPFFVRMAFMGTPP
jgi:hypothetical protein